MPYNANIPQATDILSQSQADLLNNFQAISVWVNIDHVDFGSVDEGKHNKVTFVVQSPAPSFVGPELWRSLLAPCCGVIVRAKRRLWSGRQLWVFKFWYCNQKSDDKEENLKDDWNPQPVEDQKPQHSSKKSAQCGEKNISASRHFVRKSNLVRPIASSWNEVPLTFWIARRQLIPCSPKSFFTCPVCKA